MASESDAPPVHYMSRRSFPGNPDAIKWLWDERQEYLDIILPVESDCLTFTPELNNARLERLWMTFYYRFDADHSLFKFPHTEAERVEAAIRDAEDDVRLHRERRKVSYYALVMAFTETQTFLTPQKFIAWYHDFVRPRDAKRPAPKRLISNKKSSPHKYRAGRRSALTKQTKALQKASMRGELFFKHLKKQDQIEQSLAVRTSPRRLRGHN
jgi:hypothetical protein